MPSKGEEKVKESIIIIAVIILVIAASIISQNYLNQSSDMLLGKLETLKTEIQNAKQTGALENAIELSENVLNNWEEINKNWSMLVVHEELDLIELSLIGVKASVESGSAEDALQEIDKSLFLVGHIKEKESFKIKNIF